MVNLCRQSARARCLCLCLCLLAGHTASAQLMTGPYPFTIPQYDFTPTLLEDPTKFIVIDHGGTDGNGPYAGHPDSEWLDDGTADGLILTGFPRGHGGPDTFLRLSEDGGLTWSDRLPTQPHFIGNHDHPNFDLLTAPDGTQYLNMVLAFHREHENVVEQAIMVKDPGRTWLDMLTQEDVNGYNPNWSDPAPIFDPSLSGTYGYRGYAAPKNAIQILDNQGDPILGSYFRQYHDNQGGVVKLTQINTTDGGLTWSDPVVVSNHPDFPNADPAEPGMIRSPDGSQVLSINRENSRQYETLFMVTNDEGQTWSNMQEVNPALTGDRHIARYLDDGRIIMTFRDRRRNAATSIDEGDFVLWVGTYDDIINGDPGEYRVRLLEQLGNASDTGYAGLEILPNGTIVSITYGDWTANGTTDNDVVAMRFTIEELDLLAATSSLPGDLTLDGVINLDDWAAFKINFAMDTSPLTPAQRVAAGDLDYSGLIDLYDLVAFREHYDAFNGSGASESLGPVPEPGSLAILGVGVIGLLRRRPHPIGS